MKPVKDVPEYRIAGDHFLWRHESPEDETGILVGFVFNPDDAVNLAGLLNSAVSLASVLVIPEDLTLPAEAPALRELARRERRFRRPHFMTEDDIAKLKGVSDAG